MSTSEIVNTVSNPTVSTSIASSSITRTCTLEHADQVRAANQAAYRRHQDATSLRTRSRTQGLHRTQANAVNITDD